MRQRTQIALIFTILFVVFWSGFILLIMSGCVSYKYDDCDYEKTTTTERKLNCPSGKEGGTIVMPGSRP